MRNDDHHGVERQVLDFDLGVRAYPPTKAAGYWRIRWKENHRSHDTTARSQGDAIARATEIVERLGQGHGTGRRKALGADLVAHYLDSDRRPPRVESWSERHRHDQTRLCERFVLPAIGTVPCRDLTRNDIKLTLSQAQTASVARHLRACLSALVNAGLEDGYLLVRQDLMRGARWQGTDVKIGIKDLAVTADEIPSSAAVHDLARAAADHTGTWWRELEILLVAWSGMRWGEHAALTAGQIESVRRAIRVDRQVMEIKGKFHESLPKSRRARTTMYPARTPGGLDLALMVERRLAEVPPDGLMFPAPRGGYTRRSNYNRNIWNPAATTVRWPRGGRLWAWTFHSLRHVFATWAIHHEPRIPLEDVSRLMGHSTTRVTQDIYIHMRTDIYDRFFEATA